MKIPLEEQSALAAENGIKLLVVPIPNCLQVQVPTLTEEENEDLENVSSMERGEWNGKLDFVFSCIGYAVGLGNVWRFPYLCYENGGGAFLLPYLICLVLCAIPLFFLEVAVGQYLSTGGIGIWNLVPMFKGVGFASMTIVCLYNIYFVVVIAWTLFYLVSSFTSDLPWKGCGRPWNTANCFDPEFGNVSVANVSMGNSSSPIKEFWEHHVLGISSGIDEPGNLRMELSLYLLLGWVMIYLVIWKGLHNSGKASVYCFFKISFQSYSFLLNIKV
ncbi:sodium- and chloride-dependent GABA transporter 2-like [Limulus polyphemus]|uniref:Transporter n=1 Tax=Limulus polyphemus TaxID=6850 RepID=A0ABM1SX62_LIMPO|nr:sodium- and chloride-dependent GABA transporter 2-like [Limulus polyphemus]XP_022248218.1 sodium- and chloride-dependent GABA transporter 2-like [Limulus polyphemus]